MAEKTEFLQAIDDAILDADSLEKFINGSDKETVLTRLSARYPTLQKAIKQMFENGGLPATPFKTKLLMTASSLPEGSYAVVTDDGDNTGLYRLDGGKWSLSEYNLTEQARRLATIADKQITQSYYAEYAFTIEDEGGRASLAIDKDGKVLMDSLEANNINGFSRESLGVIDAFNEDVNLYAFALADKNENIPFAVLENGTTKISSLDVELINGIAASDFGSDSRFKQGDFTGELIYFNNTGQSLGEGSDGDITVSQEYDNIGFPALSTSPTEYLPLTVANTQANIASHGDRHESPLYAALGIIKERILKEHGIAYAEQSYQLLGANNAISSLSIQALSKGSGSYNASISQVQAGYDIAQNEGRVFKVGAVFWTQGEGNGSTSREQYKALLEKYASDYNADAKGITGQTDDIPLISYQTPTASSSIALAQLDAHNTEGNNVYVATPIYFLDTYDGTHIKAYGAKILGGFYGLVYKRLVIDKEDWQPLKPISHIKQGRVVNVKFNVPHPPMVFDSSVVSTQPNMGFSLVDSSGNNLSIDSVDIINGDTVKVKATEVIPDGARLRYAVKSSGRGSGNLRDSQGDNIVYYNTPMHNYCVHFEQIL